MHTDADAMEEEVRRACGPAAADGYRRLRDWLTRLYRAEIDRFIGANHDSPLGLLGPDLARLAALGGFGRLGPQVARYLPDERLQRIFSFQALYAGVRAEPGARRVRGDRLHGHGRRGVLPARRHARRWAGPWPTPRSAAGAEILYGRTVTGLEQAGGRVTAVRHRATTDAVPTAPPPSAWPATPWSSPRTCPWSHRLARPGAPPPGAAAVLPERRRPARRASPARARSWLTTRSRFGAAWESTFREIIDDGRLMSDPSLLVTRPTATDPGLAPPGRDLLFVLAPCPNTDVGPLDWPRVGPAYRDEMLGVLEARGVGLDGLAGDIEVSRLVTPADWAADGMGAGTPFSLAHTLAQTGPFRPRNLVPGLATPCSPAAARRPASGSRPC